MSNDDEEPGSARLPDVSLYGDTFLCELVFYPGGTMYCLWHPRWSVAGSGETYAEAVLNLQEDIRVSVEQYCTNPDVSRYTESAIEFMNWLSEIRTRIPR